MWHVLRKVPPGLDSVISVIYIFIAAFIGMLAIVMGIISAPATEFAEHPHISCDFFPTMKMQFESQFSLGNLFW